MIVQCHTCGFQTDVTHWPLLCRCGTVHDVNGQSIKTLDVNPLPCVHRGRLIETLRGKRECGCGNEGVELWHCNLFDAAVLRRKVERPGRQRVESEHDFRGRYCVTCPDRKPAASSRMQETRRLATWQTIGDLQRNTARLSSLLPERIGGVAGVPRSGMLVAAQLAILHSVPLYSITSDKGIQPVGHGYRLKNHAAQGPLVVVEDSVNNGTSINAVRKHAPAGSIFAAVYCRPKSTRHVDVFAVEHPMPHYFEWHFFGSSLVRRAAFDLDGMISQECPAERDTDDAGYVDWLENVAPLWLPRPHQVQSIVTARLEKYRPQTEAWLKRWGVSYGRLVMGPWSTKAERSRHYNAGKYKGDAYRQSGATLFFESCPIQSKQIAAATGKPVICPPTGEVF